MNLHVYLVFIMIVGITALPAVIIAHALMGKLTKVIIEAGIIVPVFFLMMTFIPEFKQTVIDFLNVIFHK